jgi:ankyrin repeat protein
MLSSSKFQKYFSLWNKNSAEIYPNYSRYLQLTVPLLSIEESRSLPETDPQQLVIRTCILNGLSDPLKLMLSKGISIQFWFDDGMMPIHLTAFSGQCEILKLFLRYGADFNIEDRLKGLTPLQYSAISGNSKCMDVLISSGADMFSCGKSSSRRTPLHYAVESRSVASINSIISCFNRDPIQLVAKRAKLEELLNAKDVDGHTPLSIACIDGNIEIFQALLKVCSTLPDG